MIDAILQTGLQYAGKETMNLKHLEEEVYDILRHDFIIDEEDDEYNGDDSRNFCAVPPGILLEILNTLVVPVVTALISEFLIQKLMPEKDKQYNGIRERAQLLKSEAQKEVEHRSEEILSGNQTPSSITQNIYANLAVNIAVNSPEDGEKLLTYLEQYLRGTPDGQGPQL